VYDMVVHLQMAHDVWLNLCNTYECKLTTKRICYNCDKHGHFIDNCPFKHREDDDDKKKNKAYKKDKG
jgi:hypothetical protein